MEALIAPLTSTSVALEVTVFSFGVYLSSSPQGHENMRAASHTTKRKGSMPQARPEKATSCTSRGSSPLRSLLGGLVLLLMTMSQAQGRGLLEVESQVLTTPRLTSIQLEAVQGLQTPSMLAAVDVEPRRVCVGDSVEVSVDVSPSPNAQTPPIVAINGVPGTFRTLQLTGMPSMRQIRVTASHGGHTEARSVEVEVIDCGALVYPVLHANLSREHQTTVHFSVQNHAELGASRYEWDFGDGVQSVTSVPAVTHRYEYELFNFMADHTAFEANVAIQTPAGRVVGRKTITLRTLYALKRAKGLIEPPVDYIARVRGPIAFFTVRNVDPETIILEQQEIRFQYCDPSHDSYLYASPTTHVMIPPAASYTGWLAVPTTPSDVCNVEVHMMGYSASGIAVHVPLYLEVRTNPYLTRRVTDQDVLAMLRDVAHHNLLGDDHVITQNELLQLDREDRINYVRPDTEASGSVPTPWGDVVPLDGALECDPEDSRAPPPVEGFTCQATDEFQQRLAHIPNAQKGDIALSVNCGLVGSLLRAVDPPQVFSHTGIFTGNYAEIRNSTAAQERYLAHRAGPLVEARGIQEDYLRYGEPGPITQSVDDAYFGQSWVDEDGAHYALHTFSSDAIQCNGDEGLTFPHIVTARDRTNRPTLHRIADTAKAIEGHYRFFAYTRTALGLAPEDRTVPIDFDDFDPADRGTQCTGFIWLAAKHAGVDLERDDTPGTEDGLYFYTPEERLEAGEAIYNSIFNQVLREEGVRAFVVGAPWRFANQMVDCFARDDCGIHRASEHDWRSDPGDGFAVSPDDIMNHWDDPYGHFESLVFRAGGYRRLFRWAAAVGSGSIAGQVQRREGTPVAGARVYLRGSGMEHTTDSDGRFFFAVAPGGSQEIVAEATIDGQFLQRPERIIVHAGETSNVTLVLPDPREDLRAVRVTITGRLMDDNRDDNIEPVSGNFVIHLLRPRWDSFHEEWVLQWQRTTWVSRCVGGEVRAELRLDFAQRNDDSVDVSGIAELFEGTWCGTDDKDDERFITFWTVARDDRSCRDIRLENGERHSADFAELHICVENRRAE
jgi:hypothetical protein